MARHALRLALALFAVWARSAVAQAGPIRVALLEFAVADVDDATARELCERLRNQLSQRSEFRVSETRVSLEQLSLAQDCDPKQTACLAKIARTLAVDNLVYGTVSHESGATVAHLTRYDAARDAPVGSALATLVRQAAPEDLEHKAHELMNDLFELAAASSPFARPLSARDTALAQEATTPEKPGLDGNGVGARQLTGYVLLGGAVLSAGLSVVSFVEIDRAQRNEAYDRYRRSVGQMRPLTSDVCEEAAGNRNYGLDASAFKQVKSSCSAGKTFEVLQFVFLGGAVLSGGLSAFFLLGGSRARERPLLGNETFSLHPTVQRRGAALNARFHF